MILLLLESIFIVEIDLYLLVGFGCCHFSFVFCWYHCRHVLREVGMKMLLYFE